MKYEIVKRVFETSNEATLYAREHVCVAPAFIATGVMQEGDGEYYVFELIPATTV